MERMTPEWLAAYKAGIFTEFQSRELRVIPFWDTRCFIQASWI